MNYLVVYYMVCDCIQRHARKTTGQQRLKKREIEFGERLRVKVKSVMVLRRYDAMQSEIGSASVKDRDIVVLCMKMYSLVLKCSEQC